MCGLAGFARHPNAPGLGRALSLAEKLMLGMGARGRHATGLATVGGAAAFVWKWARPVDFALASEQWQEQRGRISPETLVLIGHTRHATHSNAHQDEAAHPFRMGQVCGAHNGIIRNWVDLGREFETGGGRDAWIVDSQAAFALLDKFEDPADALMRLDGYWALTWTKGGSLFFTRAGAPLAVAYAPELLTLFWCSEMDKLCHALDDAGFAGKYDAWEARAETLYEYDPRKFDAQGTNAIKRGLTLNRRDTRRDPRTSGRAGKGVGLDNAYPWDEIPGGFSTRRTLPAPAEDTPTAKSEGKRQGARGGARHRTEELEIGDGVSLLGLAKVVQRLARRVTELEIGAELAAGQIAALQQENAYLYEVLNAARILDGPSAEDDASVCERCGLGEEAGEMVDLPGGGSVHAACVFAHEGAAPLPA